MPKLTDAELPKHILTVSQGGSTLFRAPNALEKLFGRKEVWNKEYIAKLCAFFKNKIDDEQAVIAIVGGGKFARRQIEEAKRAGLSNQFALDNLGIAVTIQNACRLKSALTNKNINVQYYSPSLELQSGTIYVGHGDKPLHTTDYVAVVAAHDAGQNIMLNISVAGVVHPMKDDKPDETVSLQELTWDHYISTIAHQHEAGLSSPLDLPAAKYAREHGMTVIFVGPDIDNIERGLRGEEFIGTIVHP